MNHPRLSVVRAALALTIVLICGASGGLSAAEPSPAPPKLPRADYPFRVPSGWQVRLFADFPELSNPVAFCLDEQGRVYVAEEHRFNRGTEENRTRPFLLEDDLQLNTVDDRLAMYRKWASRFDGGMAWFNRYSDQVRMLEDSNGDGRSDRSTVFAGGFNGTLDGLAAGVIARDGDIYLTCIPNLWKLRDDNGDGKADRRDIVHKGFGVNAGFLGHDLHGLVWGPDGKLYFSVGDRGFHVNTREGKLLHGPRRGGVFRCDPDGSNLELVAQGLRNPQELAFDVYGNLFAVDNNCDKGDDSRLVYVVEGGDSGWNMSYQTIPSPYLTGPWHAEKLWHLQHPGQPASIVPPVGKLGAGPSGFAAYPGVGLPARYLNALFYCNFTTDGGVEAFHLKPRGAGFEMTDLHKVISPVSATDMDFGYDGRIYLSEFGKLEWDGSNEAGRIFSVEAPEARDNPVVRQVTTLFKEGFAKRSDQELFDLLGHPDMRVRQRSQYALAGRGKPVIAALGKIAQTPTNRFARLHAVWALGQLGRSNPEALPLILSLVETPDEIVRTQVVKVLGEARDVKATDALAKRLADPNDQVKLAAALALGKIGSANAVDPLIQMIRQNNDRDPFLRHAGVMGLLGTSGADPVARLLPAYGSDPSPAVRLAVLLVCRRRSDPRVAKFLNDAQPSLVTEAARAINDLPIDSATPALALELSRASARKQADQAALIRRAINANFRVGGDAQAKAVLAYLNDPTQPLELREEALSALSDWNSPPARDRVNGFWRPLPARDGTVLRSLIGKETSALLASTSGQMQGRAIDLIDRSGSAIVGSRFLAMVANPGLDTSVRLAALRLLASRKPPELAEALQKAESSNDPNLRAEGRQILAKETPENAFDLIAPIVQKSDVPVIERQRAFDTLAKLRSPRAEALLANLVSDLTSGKVAPEVRLDLLDAARSRNAPAVRAAVARYNASISPLDALGAFRPSLFGGDPARGRTVFSDNAQAQCIRCHRIAGKGGTTGPDLSQVAGRADREVLLRSLIEPDAVIAPGFGTATIALLDGRIVAGVVKAEDSKSIQIETPGGRLETIPVDQVEERTPPKSAMPKMGTVLNARDLRDLLAYLATLK